jgi:twitching motility protein PilT
MAQEDQNAINDAISKLSRVAEIAEHFSDFKISPGEAVLICNANGWKELENESFSGEEVEFLLKSMDSEWEVNILEGKISHTFQTPKWRLRVSPFLAYGGKRATLLVRRIPRDPLPLTKTGLPLSTRLFTEHKSGLILVSGPTGAGKTSTIASLVDAINETRSAHIYTIEESIEYLFVPKKSHFSQREIGLDTPTFFSGVHAAMRHRPQVIVIGEIRDRETAATALLAGESGHLVLATLHANSAYTTIQKMMSFFPGEAEFRLPSFSASLIGIISQQMLPHKDGTRSVMASEVMFNHKQQFATHFNNQAMLMNAIERKEDKLSCSMANSIADLVKNDLVTKSDALSETIANPALYSKVRELIGD